MANERVAFIGWHEGSAGQIHSWFEAAGLGKVVCFIHPEAALPEIKPIARAVSQFAYPQDGKFKGLPLYCAPDWPALLKKEKIDAALITISDSSERLRELKKARAEGVRLVNAIHPTALLMPECKLGTNVILHARALIGYRAELDDGVIVNVGTHIDHHAKIHECVTFDPGVTLAGNVEIHSCATIHTRATIINRISVGGNAIVGAGAVVIRDIPADTKVVGIPGKKIPY